MGHGNPFFNTSMQLLFGGSRNFNFSLLMLLWLKVGSAAACLPAYSFELPVNVWPNE